MDLDRVKRWVVDLTGRVEKEGGENSRQMFFWLIEHLAEYVQRWIGFAQIEQVAVKSTFSNDLFCLIVAAIEVVNKRTGDVKNMNWFPQVEWEKFEIALEFIREHPSKENLSFVSQSFDDLLTALPSRSS